MKAIYVNHEAIENLIQVVSESNVDNFLDTCDEICRFCATQHKTKKCKDCVFCNIVDAVEEKFGRILPF